MENRPKKNIFKIIVYLLNIITIIIMLVDIFNAFDKTEYWYDKNGNLCYYDDEGNIRRYYAFDNFWENLEPFNSQFTVYDGKSITGSQIKELVEIVNKSNVQNARTDLIVKITGYQFNGVRSKRYVVEIEKEDGIVNNINIYNTSDNQNNVITNKINEKNIDNNTKNNVFYNFESGLTNLISYLPIIIIYIIIIAYRKINKKKILKEDKEESNQYELDKIDKKSLIAFLVIDICLIIYIIII